MWSCQESLGQVKCLYFIIEHLTHIFSHLVVFINLYHINLNIFTSHLFSQIQIVHENQARMLMGPPQNSGCFSFFRRDRRESKDWQPTTPEIDTAPYTRTCECWKCTKGEGSWRLYFSCRDLSRFQLIISATLNCHFTRHALGGQGHPWGSLFVLRCLKCSRKVPGEDSGQV